MDRGDRENRAQVLEGEYERVAPGCCRICRMPGRANQGDGEGVFPAPEMKKGRLEADLFIKQMVPRRGLEPPRCCHR